MINNWLEHNEQVSSYSFRSIYVGEKAKSDNGTIEFLQEKIITSYRNFDFYKFYLENSSESDIRNFVLNQVIPANITQFDKNVRQGDWGEILSALIVAYFQDLEVPINKLQWKLNKDKAVFGTDLFAYNKGDKITDVYYYEIKTRLNPKNKEGKAPNRNYITVIAHNSLAKDESAPTESIAEFLSRLFFEMGKLNEAKKFKDIVKNPQNYKRNFELFFIIDRDNFDIKILDELNALPSQLDPLKVTLIFIEDLQLLVENTWNDIESALVKLLKDE
ncbi:Hachiman antiphage defense system protein HamA [Gelidibacter mesophilus]|uniref:Hachiman antiphage defense system protein HamA n=1 Tax=Gelidibacter mesophilus TaxID=169050 RepID=UPI0003F6BDF0|nr:Hachiman antiphage defense system protein HamA [Gelidibacter mesophilus]